MKSKILLLVVFFLFQFFIAQSHASNEHPTNTVFYNPKEHGYFKIDCKTPIANRMACKVDQLFFIDDTYEKRCVLQWNSNVEIFKYNLKNKTWNSLNDMNNKCGIVNFSSLYENEKGYWEYKFHNDVRHPNNKIDHSTKCKIYDGISETIYTSKYEEINLSCEKFELI